MIFLLFVFMMIVCGDWAYAMNYQIQSSYESDDDLQTVGIFDDRYILKREVEILSEDQVYQTFEICLRDPDTSEIRSIEGSCVAALGGEFTQPILFDDMMFQMYDLTEDQIQKLKQQHEDYHDYQNMIHITSRDRNKGSIIIGSVAISGGAIINHMNTQRVKKLRSRDVLEIHHQKLVDQRHIVELIHQKIDNNKKQLDVIKKNHRLLEQRSSMIYVDFLSNEFGVHSLSELDLKRQQFTAQLDSLGLRTQSNLSPQPLLISDADLQSGRSLLSDEFLDFVFQSIPDSHTRQKIVKALHYSTAHSHDVKLIIQLWLASHHRPEDILKPEHLSDFFEFNRVEHHLSQGQKLWPTQIHEWKKSMQWGADGFDDAIAALRMFVYSRGRSPTQAATVQWLKRYDELIAPHQKFLEKWERVNQKTAEINRLTRLMRDRLERSHKLIGQVTEQIAADTRTLEQFRQKLNPKDLKSLHTRMINLSSDMKLISVKIGGVFMVSVAAISGLTGVLIHNQKNLKKTRDQYDMTSRRLDEVVHLLRPRYKNLQTSPMVEVDDVSWILKSLADWLDQGWWWSEDDSHSQSLEQMNHDVVRFYCWPEPSANLSQMSRECKNVTARE